MICAYCGKKAKGTKEHIISSGVLGLFPECFVTIDEERNRVYQKDPMVKDVCADCNNNKISYIDSYAKKIVELYFMTKYNKNDTLEFKYDYSLIQKMCLKYAFNDLRSRKKSVDFFDDEIKKFILNENKVEPLRNVTVLAGLAVNTSPVPDFVFGNRKLRWGDNPYFLSNSIVSNLNYETGKITLRDDNERESFNNLAVSYVFRLNSLQLLLLCWDKEIDDEQLKRNNIVLEIQYPYTRLTSEGKSLLSRCTSEVTYHHEKLIDVRWGQGMMDEISEMRGIFLQNSQQYLSEIDDKWREEERILAKKHPRHK